MASGGGNRGRKNGGSGINQNSKQIPFRNWNSDPIIDNDDDDDDFVDEVSGEHDTCHFFNKYRKGKDKNFNKSITSIENTKKHIAIKEKRLS